MRPRPATESDLDRLVRLDGELMGADAWPETVWRDQLSASPAVRRVLVLEHAGEPVAYAVLSMAGAVADLDRLAVAVGHRRRGLAAGLLAEVVGLARASGCERLLLEVRPGNEAAVALYGSAGFRRVAVRPRYYADGGDAVVLGLQL